MCIRDSTGRDAGDAVVLQGAQVAIVFGQALDDGQRSFAGSVHRGVSFLSVSYTHLDVYKRQW